MRKKNKLVPTQEVSLPDLPSSWEQLTPEQMTGLNAIRHTRIHTQEEYLFKSFCFLLGIELVKGGGRMDKESFCYEFRRKEDKTVFYMQSWEVQFFVDNKLQWLMKDCDRLSEVYPKIELGGKTFSGPGYAMANMTYQQYQYAQRYQDAYYNYTRGLLKLLEKQDPDNEDRKKAEQWIGEREQMRRNFLSAVFTPACQITTRLVDGAQILYDPPIEGYVFSSDQIERYAPLFADFPEEKSDAMMQHFNGVQLYYKRIFPMLYGEGDGGKHDFIEIEQSTMNMLQDKLHLSYQQIYDSNAPFILGKLNEIIKEGKQIEEMNARMKLHKK